MSPSSDNSALRQRLLSLLVAETRQVREFIVVLEQERKILGERDVEPLFALSEQKNRFARLLQQSADARTLLLNQAGLQHDKAGVENLLGDPEHPAWGAYLKAVAEARTLNQANGKQLTERLAHNHQALAILMAHSDQPTVYGPDGSARMRPGSRLLGSY